MSESVINHQQEREVRNGLYSEIETQMLRVAFECSDNPYGDLPEADTISPFSRLASDPAFRLGPVHWHSRHWYTLNGAPEAAILYQQRQKGTGYYLKLRTAKELETEVLVTDYAIKPDAPGKSINWIDLWFSRETNKLLIRDGRDTPNDIERVWEIVKGMSLKGEDLEPGNFNPHAPEDYERTKLRLLKVATILGKLTSATQVSDLEIYPDSLRKYIALPYTYSLFGPKIDQLFDR